MPKGRITKRAVDALACPAGARGEGDGVGRCAEAAPAETKITIAKQAFLIIADSWMTRRKVL